MSAETNETNLKKKESKMCTYTHRWGSHTYVDQRRNSFSCNENMITQTKTPMQIRNEREKWIQSEMEMKSARSKTSEINKWQQRRWRWNK